MMKRRLLLLTIIVLCMAASTSAYAFGSLQALFLDGLPVNLPGAVLSGGSYFVPIRPLANSLGLSVSWDERLRQVHLENTHLQIILSTTETIRINGAKYVLDRNPFLRQGQLFVPIRAFIEALGGQVDYVSGAEEIYLYMPSNAESQISVASAEIDTVIFKDESSVGLFMKSNATYPLNTVVVVTTEDGRLGLVDWVDRQSGLPFTAISPGTEYNAQLRFPTWVSDAGLVTVAWVDSTRFRGEKAPDLDTFFSFSISFRPRNLPASVRSID